MDPVPASGRDCEIRNRSRVGETAQTTAQVPAADSEYLPMDVYVDSESRRAHFRFSLEQVNHRRSRRTICP
jgi:hypothetical protein